MIKHLIDLVGGLPQAKRGIVEGLIVTAYLTAVYYAWKEGFEKQLTIFSAGVLVGLAIALAIILIKKYRQGGY